MRETPPPRPSHGATMIVVEGDITGQEVDAIVNPANPTLLGGGGADGAIHRAAGPALREEYDLSRSDRRSSNGAQRRCECRALGGCRTGEAKITGGYRLPARFVIHTVGPVWHGGGEGEDDLLAACSRSSLLLAGERGLASIAFPAISTGAYGFPLERAARIAVATVLETLHETPSIQLVIFVCHGRDAAGIYRRVIGECSRHGPPGTGEPDRSSGPVPPSDQGTVDRVGAHLATIQSAYGIRIANFTPVVDRIAGATSDDREILAIATAISSYVAVQPPSEELEIPGTLLDEAVRRFAGRRREAGPRHNS
jgi:O-acetyl-ADP-ribose deacetylase (regulator of RNase III)